MQKYAIPGVCSKTQGFGDNFNSSYAEYGLKGHPAIDDVCGYGSTVYNPVDQHIYKVLTKDRPAADGSGLTGVFGIVDNGVECYELLRGHMNPTVYEGQFLRRGEVVGTEANNGRVWSGGMEITLAMQKAGDKRGSHRHDQKRPVRPVAVTRPSKKYLTAHAWDWPAGEFFRKDGFYYEIWDFENGYAGCVDPLAPVFFRNLKIGMSGYDIWCLQRLLVRDGFGSFEPTGYFGFATLAAVIHFQLKNKIYPSWGFVYEKTRSVLNALVPNGLTAIA